MDVTVLTDLTKLDVLSTKVFRYRTEQHPELQLRGFSRLRKLRYHTPEAFELPPDLDMLKLRVDFPMRGPLSASLESLDMPVDRGDDLIGSMR
jgi:hypothetical protein